MNNEHEYTVAATATKVNYAEYLNSQTGRICHGWAYEVVITGTNWTGETFKSVATIPASKGKKYVEQYCGNWGADVEFKKAA